MYIIHHDRQDSNKNNPMACYSPPEAPQPAMVVKQVTVHGLASQPNRPDAIRQALKDFEDDLHAGHVMIVFSLVFLFGYDQLTT